MTAEIDNGIYDRMADLWWAERGPLSLLRTGMNPARVEYLRTVVCGALALDPHGRRALDLGCGGGLLAEELARLGCAVTGVDPSAPSIAVARAHAAGAGLPIEYHVAAGEALPFADASFDLVCCCDVLEHVADPERVIAETARVLRPGGVYCFDTIDRTRRSRLLLITLLQDWPPTRLLPRDLHVWHQFIRPGELRALLARHGLDLRRIAGLSPRAGPLRLARALYDVKRGAISQAELGRRAQIAAGRHVGLSYIGYAVRR
jgi:2-polyprenyl-6-hydroxyphenyl methylase/3-demethylubiquinone-9 3-methyltransferase